MDFPGDGPPCRRPSFSFGTHPGLAAHRPELPVVGPCGTQEKLTPRHPGLSAAFTAWSTPYPHHPALPQA